ncbi:MAG: HAMP domain-containing histidine kinase, partial [Deltaproteobacteria bacterium]|nr:HAMP domain-containing histidine kinase [Deltaproteobacteria bacterium]
MNNLSDSDKELIEGLVNRLSVKDKAINDLTVVTKKLETLNNKLLDSENTKSQFLSNIRNEINNPLASIMGLSKIISTSEGLLNPDIISMGNAIYKEAFNLEFQMENIFAAAEIEAGEAALSVSNVDIKSLIQHTIDSFNHWACEKKIKVALNLIDYIKKGESFFKTDPKKFQLIVSNLLANAIEYSFEEGQVDVKIWKNGDSLNTSIKDNGIGIDEKDHRIIFDRFRQLDTGLTKSHRGHGLG